MLGKRLRKGVGMGPLQVTCWPHNDPPLWCKYNATLPPVHSIELYAACASHQWRSWVRRNTGPRGLTSFSRVCGPFATQLQSVSFN